MYIFEIGEVNSRDCNVGAKLSIYAEPEKLYRFRPSYVVSNGNVVDVLNREFDALRHQEVWCGTLLKLNDPLEGLLNINEFDGIRDISKLSKMKDDIGLASFSEDWKNLAMWAHYASGGSGVCIAYNYKSLLATLPGDCEFLKVSYNRDVPAIQQRMSEEMLLGIALSNKIDCWSYEKEWRLVSPKSGLVRYGRKRALHGIYLGINYPESFIAGAKIVAINLGCFLYRVSIDSDGKMQQQVLVRAKQHQASLFDE